MKSNKKMHGISDQYVSPDVSSSETQGQSVGSGEKAGRKFSSMGKRAHGYRLSPNYFQKIQSDAGSWLGTKNALYYCAQSANSFSWVLFVSSPNPTDCSWVSEDADEPTLLFTNLTKGFVQIFESKIRDVFQNNRAIYTRKNKTRTFCINGTFRLK